MNTREVASCYNTSPRWWKTMVDGDYKNIPSGASAETNQTAWPPKVGVGLHTHYQMHHINSGVLGATACDAGCGDALAASALSSRHRWFHFYITLNYLWPLKISLVINDSGAIHKSFTSSSFLYHPAMQRHGLGLTCAFCNF